MATEHIQVGGQLRGVSGTATGNTEIFVTENGPQRWRAYFFIVELATVGGLTGNPVISIGQNASSYDDMTGGGLTLTLAAVNDTKYWKFGSGFTAPANVSVRVRVITAAVATAYTLNLFVLGAYD